jgi:hypothetical protein
VDSDVHGALRLAASEDKLAPFNDETIAALRAKHPHRGPPQLNKSINHECEGCVSNIASLQLNESDIYEAIRSFPAGSASGLDALKPQYLKDMIYAHFW